ncbi:MAG: sortase [Dethiobacter sp.]|nr:sortase [Dethiobacter sp.]MBS3901081.1 sortase [Dethiobacter sp.]MBS3988895.1 sortase [Dethiobacter sp.]
MVVNTNTLPKVFFVATGLLVALAINLLLSDALEVQKYRATQALALAGAGTAAEETAPLAAVLILPVEQPPAVEQPPTPAPTTQSSPSQHQGLGHSPPPAAAILAAPAIGLRVVVFDQGVSEAALRKGPAFFPGRSSPAGRVAIAGHKGRSGGPFRRIGDLQPGDIITLTIPGGGEYAYRVTGSHIVYERDWSLIDNPTPALVLQACLLGLWQAEYRLIITAEPYQKQ